MADPADVPSSASSRLSAIAQTTGQETGQAPAGPRTIRYAEQLDEGRTFSISPEVEIVLGYTQAEWMADPLLWVDLLHPDDRERVVVACNLANERLEPFRAEYRMIDRAGRVVHIMDVAMLVYGAQGQPLCWEGVMTVRETPSSTG
jgi:PAS domain-containing protein